MSSSLSAIGSVVVFGKMIKLSHSVFALPFALAGVALAARSYGIEGLQLVWIVIAMVSARSAAMGFNRLADRVMDGKNPRTRDRALPTGRIAPRTVAIIVGACCALFVFSAYQLNELCFQLSPLALLVILSYSYFKRFTWATHLVLGLSLAIAPVGAWIAVTGTFDFEPIWLAAAVLTWVAGFDIIYACQDYEFDVAQGVHSIPRRFGIRPALVAARLLHAATVVFLLAVHQVFDLHALYLCGTVLATGMLVYEHTLVKADDLSKIDVAFFNTNGLVSVVFFVFLLGDILWPI
ncbi:MAG: 4-hydroxybenzoate octaprenyltransferase [Gemmatimonadetes bacterium]|nr:4-hydroxybenzoate octaprenyltransferase [Gemmatimonadota bacterium]MYG17044.1 4-hydroxybenzoate octaprenyltransferase [Gemmatimonadota bacterium]